jgi:tetratricopeptide (TPR) repeat protein
VLEATPREEASNRNVLFLLATSYQSLEQYDKAIRLYEQLRTREPVEGEVFYNLGLCYGRMNRLALAHYYFGLSFKRAGTLPKARFHFEKAQELGQNDPELLRKIRKELESPPDKQKRPPGGKKFGVKRSSP